MLNVFDAVQAGRGGVLAISGQAGVGKSRLVQEAVGRHGMDLRIITTTGAQFEAGLPYTALQQVCAPLLEDLGSLAAAHAEALSRAFALDRALPGRPMADDGFLTLGVGVQALLARAAARTPVIWVVDDVQWIDEASARILAFVARRIASTSAGLVVAARDDDVLASFGGASLRLAGLPDPEARDLLTAAVGTPLDPRVRDRIVAEARGNPLALLELPHAISTAGLVGGYGCPPHQPLPETLEAEFGRRLAALPEASSMLCLLAAAEPTGEAALLWQATARLGIPAAAGTAAEATGLVSFGAQVLFRHPLARAAAYHGGSDAQRRAAHRALADVIDPVRDPDRRAWHLASAATGPDEAVAAELARCADRARARGGAAAAAVFLEQAAHLTPDPRQRAGRLLAAAAAKRAAGWVPDATALLAEAARDPRDARQVALTEVLRARLAFDLRRDPDALMRLLTAGEHAVAVDAVLAREVLREAYAAVVFVGRYGTPDAGSRIAAATAVLPPVPEPSSRDLLFEGLFTERLDGPAAATAVLRRAVDRYTEEPASRYTLGDLWLACAATLECWDENAFREVAHNQLRAVRDSGAISSLPVALSYRALAHVYEGQFAEAQRLVDESHRIAADLGTPAMAYVDVTIAAWRGDQAAVEQIAAVATADATVRKEGRLLTAVEYARAVLLNGLGRYGEAMDVSARAALLDEVAFRTTVPGEFIEGAVGAGRVDLAVSAVQRLRRAVAGATDRDWAMGLLSRCEALVADDADLAEQRFQDAVARFSRTTLLTELARTQLLYGEWLRRAGRDAPARTALRAAYESLTALGAGAFAARARRELTAAGGRPRHSAARAGARLTDQERQVALVVAGGATSKEAAGQLYLSPRTVDAHLRSIFAKLGVTSRRQLAEALRRADATDRVPDRL
ncbi:LuxR family transcriptional regulator [Catenuloplanes niger JCM 9533]